MNVYFSLEYNNCAAYLGLKTQQVMMDTMVTDIGGLYGFLELRLGLHAMKRTEAERLVCYYKCVRDYMRAHHDDADNQLYDSYTVSPLAASREMLKWRDALAMCGWTKGTPAPSRRLKVLQGVECLFAEKDDVNQCIRHEAIVRRLKQHKGMMHGVNFILPHTHEWLHPAVRELFDLAVADGAAITVMQTPEITGDDNLARLKRLLTAEGVQKINLDPDDESVRIWHFKDEVAAGEWLARLDDDAFDITVQADTKLTDNYLHMMGKPATGSSVSNSTPQIIQLFFTGVALLARPLNISALMQWLYAPIHPLPGKLRYLLAERLARTGGWNSKDTDERSMNCYQVVQGWLEGKAEAEKGEPIDQKEKDRRKALTEVFLPDFEGGNETTVKAEKLHRFLTELSGWARQRAAIIAGDDEGDQRVAQLGRLAELSDTLKSLTDDEAPEADIPFVEIEKHIACLYEPSEFVQYRAQATARWTVHSPGQVAGKADKVLWAGMYNYEAMLPATHFLTPTEVDVLKEHLRLWDADDVRKIQQQTMLLPVLFCQKQLTLVTVDTIIAGEDINQHPLIVRIRQQVDNHRDITTAPAFGDEAYTEVEPMTDNKANGHYAEIKRTDLIKWRDNESPTSVEKLLQNPIDYTLENIAYIRDNGQSELNNIALTKGNVAHGVIQLLFHIPGQQKSGYPDAIRQRVKMYYKETFDSIVETKGAILLMLEYAIERRQLYDQLHECIDHLIDIIEKNKLHVVACEMPLSGNTFGQPQPGITPRMNGFADMVLAYADGRHVIFDFKWTSSRRYYQGLLQQNRSVQLAIYAELLHELTEDHPLPTAYFLMPQGRLYSTYDFTGYYTSRVTVDAGCQGDIIGQIVKSYQYRREEIMSGRIELGEGQLLESLDFYNDTEAQCLFPLKPDYNDDKRKETNQFSNYSHLKS